MRITFKTKFDVGDTVYVILGYDVMKCKISNVYFYRYKFDGSMDTVGYHASDGKQSYQIEGTIAFANRDDALSALKDKFNRDIFAESIELKDDMHIRLKTIFNHIADNDRLLDKRTKDALWFLNQAICAIQDIQDKG